MYTDGIIGRLNNPALDNPNNDGYKVIDGTIGEYLEHYKPQFTEFFLLHSTGDWLDLHAKEYGLIRKDDETDDEFLNRVVLDISLVENAVDFEKVGVHLFVYDTNVVDNKNYLTSDNKYLKEFHDVGYMYMAFVDEETKAYLENKFILEDILWL